MSTRQPDRSEIEAELARLLASPDFAKNPGASSFLKFVVEETLEGRGDRLKAFTIATQALERKDDFDARLDSAVRVQALRLRRLLDAWYEGPGADSPVRIQLTRGTYKPVFVYVSAPVAGGPAAEAAAAPAAAPDRSLRRYAGAVGLALSIFLFALFGLMTEPASPPGASSANAPPIPSLRIERAEDAPKTLTEVAQALEVDFSALDTVILRKPDADPATVNAYALALRPLEKSYVAELVRLSDRTIVWAEQLPLPEGAGAIARQARELTQRLGDAYGVIDVDALRLLNKFDGMPRGFNCTLTAFTFLKTQSTDRMRVARECLEIAVAANPRDDDARAMLAIALVYYYIYAPLESEREAALARAEKLAKEAFDLAPRRARSYFARFITAFAAGRYEEAFSAARGALALNDNSTLFARVIGTAYVVRGEVEAGMALLTPLANLPGEYAAALGAAALGHELRGEKREAAQLLARPGASERPLALILQLSLCGADADCARDPFAELRRNFPGIAADIGSALDRMGLAEPVKARLLPGLRAAKVLAAER
ncbi:tetratricopeptide (TPR) repeat protein [Rhodoblastus acidophilus]|uniref:hypothetical protein n=1 Tax=Rhodoblastus acidophilus TaxID=1074 RepID=UPI00222410E8|nr:hypothetical protein [Rhodoblastus acidophilus]MCW2282546.1 tetratricopeptide (TPR) repeat protein [Rhodoblastus acidophilus]MCW2331407.1 tetratricopeptide (TPR) repeat protein [Rhodoblastus acidophilus]